jgi:hypothetical protein
MGSPAVGIFNATGRKPGVPLLEWSCIGATLPLDGGFLTTSKQANKPIAHLGASFHFSCIKPLPVMDASARSLPGLASPQLEIHAPSSALHLGLSMGQGCSRDRNLTFSFSLAFSCLTAFATQREVK